MPIDDEVSEYIKVCLHESLEAIAMQSRGFERRIAQLEQRDAFSSESNLVENQDNLDYRIGQLEEGTTQAINGNEMFLSVARQLKAQADDVKRALGFDHKKIAKWEEELKSYHDHLEEVCDSEAIASFEYLITGIRQTCESHLRDAKALVDQCMARMDDVEARVHGLEDAAVESGGPVDFLKDEVNTLVEDLVEDGPRLSDAEIVGHK